MSLQPTTRRRFMSICAAASAFSMLPASKLMASPALHHWRGILLGSEVSLSLAHPSKKEAQKIFASCVKEIKRLEQIFTLYDAHSELSTLNSQGYLVQPSREMVDILQQAKRYHRITHNAFDVTVKPLEEGSSALDKVGIDKLRVTQKEIRFMKQGMGVTLNGIAQGYITDRMTDVLKHMGLKNVLVELGEKRAIGAHPSGRPWRLLLENTNRVVELNQQAMATSAAINPGTNKPHIISAMNGKAEAQHHSVSVVAKTATMADALSTGFMLLSRDQITDIYQADPSIYKVYVL